jgi:hypothetical protein
MTTTLAVPDVLPLADELADRLRDPGTVWPDGLPSDALSMPQSLAAGAVGIALLHVERARSGRGDWETAHTWLTLATSGEITAAANANLFFGVPALAFVLHCAASASHRYQRTLTKLNDAVCGITQSRLDQAHARIDRSEQPEMREFDLVRGLAGFATYHLARHPDHKVTHAVLAYLARLTEPLAGTSALPSWWVRVGPNGEPSTDYRQGHGNVGVSHGIGSVLAVLSLAQLRGLGSTAITDAIARICAWTDEWRQGELDTPWWPGLITIGQVRDRRVAAELQPVPSWCYGVSGTSRIQQLAGMALHDSTRQQVAENAMLSTLREPTQQARLNRELGLCHGAAGLLHCAWRISADALIPGLRMELPVLASQLTDELGSTGQLVKPGLLDGMAGIALALHSFGTGSVPAPCWDSFLALA